MKQIIRLMKARAVLLKRAIKAAENDAKKKDFPEGHLRISRSGGYPRYYHVTDPGQPIGKYIPQKEGAFVKKLAEKDYIETFLAYAKKELSELERLITSLSKKNADKAFEKLSVDRRGLLRPYIIPDTMYAEEWIRAEYRTNQFMPERKIYDTKKGDKVRSKSEAILADMFYDLGTPYRYEAELKLKNGAVRYPDFTLLKTVTREEIYFEHFGLLDDEEYRTGCLKKMDEYRENGIYPGRNLLFSYETEESPLDIKGIGRMIKEIFKE